MYTVYIHMNHHCLSNHDYTYSSPKIESKQLDTWEWTGRNHHHNPLPFLETYFSIRSPWLSHYIQIHSDFRSINRHENTSFPLGPPAHPGPGAALRLHWWSPQGHGSRQFFIIWCPPGAPHCRTTAAPACSSRTAEAIIKCFEAACSHKSFREARISEISTELHSEKKSGLLAFFWAPSVGWSGVNHWSYQSRYQTSVVSQVYTVHNIYIYHII